ncbi:flagellar export chaperone FlgN [Mucisphaera calidilacus]|uniref:FlgN protein n=1 Tax=Mucisphaera calidilacus TaxID=2527982 RepID=A0A518BYZ6_9BACT|nr:flagellar export chaperone FlgN [Mucisphaera calidilacus]QDU72193.1 FlgN protein [Mucisphaera calidilacus]
MTGDSNDISIKDAQALLDLVAQQRDLYQTLRLLSNQQNDYITKGQTEKLLSLLTRRQTLLDELRSVAEKIRPFRESWDQVRADLSEPNRLKLRAILDETDTLMRDIMERDRSDGDRLKQAQSSAKARMSRVGTARHAVRAYQGNAGAAYAPPASNSITDSQG